MNDALGISLRCVTSEPAVKITVCGGYTEQAWTSSCLVLDQINQRWDDTKMGSLTVARGYSAVARLNYVGVFLIGGNNNNNQRTSEFLAAGTLQWRKGPTLPEDMTFPCAVAISAGYWPPACPRMVVGHTGHCSRFQPYNLI